MENMAELSDSSDGSSSGSESDAELEVSVQNYTGSSSYFRAFDSLPRATADTAVIHRVLSYETNKNDPKNWYGKYNFI